MVYYRDNVILIRDMVKSDAQIITDEEIAQGWHQTIEKYETRLQDQAEGKAIALVAEYKGKVAGYINVYPDSKWGAFANLGYPEIVDFGVFIKYRNNGIGTKLMDAAEEIASEYAMTRFTSESVCTAGTGALSVCMLNADTFPTEPGYGTVNMSVRNMPTAAMTTNLPCIFQRN